MSYPKVHPLKAMALQDSRTLMKTQKREQLKNMLINKFRVKYNIKSDSDNFDAIIRDEVEALMQSNALTEQDLTQMDKRLK
jgi:hypothetical protein